MANTQNLTGWLDYISQQHTEVIDMGLERFNQVLDRMQLRNPTPAVITVAGTNGKGTTCRMIEALLLHGGYRVGSTLSPHIWRFNERIRLHGKEASDDVMAKVFKPGASCKHSVHCVCSNHRFKTQLARGHENTDY